MPDAVDEWIAKNGPKPVAPVAPADPVDAWIAKNATTATAEAPKPVAPVETPREVSHSTDFSLSKSLTGVDQPNARIGRKPIERDDTDVLAKMDEVEALQDLRHADRITGSRGDTPSHADNPEFQRGFRGKDGRLDRAKTSAYLASVEKGHRDALKDDPIKALIAHGLETAASQTTLGIGGAGLGHGKQLVSENPTVQGPWGQVVGAGATVAAAANPIGPVAMLTRALRPLGAAASPLAFGAVSGIEHGDAGVGVESALFATGAGVGGRLLAGPGAGAVRRGVGEFLGAAGTGAAISKAKGEDVDWPGLLASSGLFGVMGAARKSPLTKSQYETIERARRIAEKVPDATPDQVVAYLKGSTEAIPVETAMKIEAADNPVAPVDVTRSPVADPAAPAVERDTSDRLTDRPLPFAPEEAVAPPVGGAPRSAAPEIATETASVAERPVAAPMPVYAAPVAPQTTAPTPTTDPTKAALEAMTAPEAPFVPNTAREVAGARAAGRSVEPPSLTQHLRSEGGIDLVRETETGGMVGETNRLRLKDSGTTGLVDVVGGRGKTWDRAHRSAVEAGLFPAESTLSEFVEAVHSEAGPAGPRRSAEQIRADEGGYSLADKQRWEDAGRPPMEPEPVVNAAGPDYTSTKKRIVDADRIARGLKPLDRSSKETFEGWVDEAARIIGKDPSRPETIVYDLAEIGRAATPVERAILNVRRVDLYNFREIAHADGVRAAERFTKEGKAEDAQAAQEAANRFAKHDTELVSSELIDVGTRGQAGKDLAAIKMEINRDYSPHAIEMKRRAEDGYKPLSPEKMAETKAMAAEIKRLTDALTEANVRVEASKLRQQVSRVLKGEDATVPSGKEYGRKNTIVNRESYEKARAEVRSALSRSNLNMFAPVSAVPALVKMGVFHVEAGSRKFTDWVKAMKSDAPEIDENDPRLPEVFAESMKRHDVKTVENVSGRVRDRMLKGEELAASHEDVNQLALMFTRQGLTGRDQVIDAVHERIAAIDPRVTKRDVSELLVNYGKEPKPLDMEEAKVELREIKAQELQILRLQDMANGVAPKGVGVVRMSPSDATRALIRLVNEAKKAGGYEVRDPVAETKSALASAKTRWEHEIADMDREIASGKKDIPSRKTLDISGDAAAVALKAKRDAKKAEYDRVFGRPELTDAQRITMAAKAAERSLKELDRQVSTGDIAAKRKPAAPTDAHLEAVRAKRDAKRAELEELRRVDPKITTEREVKRLQQSIAQQRKELERFLTTGVHKTRADKVESAHPDVVKYTAELDTAKKRVQEAYFRDKMEKQTFTQKAVRRVFTEPMNLSRALMTSFDFSAVLRQGGFIALGNPLRAARAMIPMFKAFRSEAHQAKSEAELSLRQNYGLAKRSGLFLAEHGDVSASKMEEAFRSRLVDKIPTAIGGGIIRGSQRAYTTFLNRLRMDSFDAMISTLSKGRAPTKAEAQAVAEYVNVATGRGGGKEGKVLGVMNAAFFAPRLVASRFQLLAGQPMYGGSARTRLLVAREYAKFTIGLATAMILGKLMGGDLSDDDDDDPSLLRANSADFGKIRADDTRIDLTAGLAPVAVFTHRILNDVLASMGVVDERVGKPTGDVMFDFARSKAAPFPGAAFSATTGKRYDGEETNWGKEGVGLVTPMIANDIRKAYVAYGLPEAVATWLAATFGVGANTYPDKKQKSAPTR